MKELLIIYFVWFLGKQMIAQETDSLPRGDLTSGIMTGDKFLKFIPLNETDFEREEGLQITVWS